jgi:hypothetical protein
VVGGHHVDPIIVQSEFRSFGYFVTTSKMLVPAGRGSVKMLPPHSRTNMVYEARQSCTYLEFRFEKVYLEFDCPTSVLVDANIMLDYDTLSCLMPTQ